MGKSSQPTKAIRASRNAWLLLVLIVAVALAGCANGRPGPSADGPIGDADRGRVLFSQAVIQSTQGCGTCHSLEVDKIVVGPSLNGIAARAVEIISSPEYQGTAATAEEFLRESITRPDAAVEAGFSHSIMPDWLTVLDRQEIEDLVAFLSTLK